MQLALDSSAVLAWVFQEPGWTVVDELISRTRDGEVALLLPGPVLTEVVYQARRQGNTRDARGIAERLLAQGFVVEPSVAGDLLPAAELMEAAVNRTGISTTAQRAARLSVGDSLILAAVTRIGCPILTRDRLWLDLVDEGIVTARVRLL